MYYEVTQSTASINVYPGYTGKENQYDAGCVIFNKAYTGTTDFFKLNAILDSFFNSTQTLRVCGYAPNENGYLRLYNATGTPKGLYNTSNNNGKSFYHSVSTYPGESGSPVFYSPTSSVRLVVGIHTNGYNIGVGTQYNTAFRITQEFIDWVNQKN